MHIARAGAAGDASVMLLLGVTFTVGGDGPSPSPPQAGRRPVGQLSGVTGLVSLTVFGITGLVSLTVEM